MSASLRLRLAQIEAQLDRNAVAEAMSAAAELIRATSVEELELVLPDVRNTLDRFFHKRRRDLIALLELKTRAPRAAGSIAAPTPAVSLMTVAADYAARLDKLRDSHIFQWNTFYRETIGYIFKDVARNVHLVEGDERKAFLMLVRSSFRRHSREIFELGFHFTTTTSGLSDSAAQAKSLGGLPRFIFLVIEQYLQNRLDAQGGRRAGAFREACSAILGGVLLGYGDAVLGSQTGLDLLHQNPRTWAHALAFMTGEGCLGLGVSDKDTVGLVPPAFRDTVLPVLLAVDQVRGEQSFSDSTAIRFSRIVSDPQRLELAIVFSNRAEVRDILVSCFLEEPLSGSRVYEDIIARGTSLVVAGGAEQEPLDSERPAAVIDAGYSGSWLEHVHVLADQIAYTLSELISARADIDGARALLTQNYAQKFPLEDPQLRAYFLVQRNSVKNLLEMIERGTGVHVWCSVRRSGKTTATSDLAGLTGRSTVTIQTMDQQPHAPEANIFYERFNEALQKGTTLPATFFRNVVAECAAALNPVQTDASKRVFVIDEYELLFGRLNAVTREDDALRYTVAQPLLSQMVSYAIANLLVFLGQRPDAHYILLAHNQLSPLVRQEQFPLFSHEQGGRATEFSEFLQRVLQENLPFSTSFADAVYEEASGHPFLTVNLMVDFCQWLIERGTPAAGITLSDADFIAFARERLSAAALMRSPYYGFFQRMLAEYLSELSRRREPWLYAVATTMQRVVRDHPRTFGCPLSKFKEVAVDVASIAGVTPEQLLLGASMSNFLESSGGLVRPAIRLMGRLAAVTPAEAN